MNTSTTGGHDARRANAYALHLELGLPIGGTVPAAVKFASVTGIDMGILDVAASKVAESGWACVIAIYADEQAAAPHWYLALMPHSEGVIATKVIPAALGDDQPLVLMAEDRRQQFAIGECGRLIAMPVEAAARRARSHRNAAKRIAATAETLAPLCTGGPTPGDLFVDGAGNIRTAAPFAA
ncbi:hypothetical protein A3718_08375 [Erythrobacter sp. HI0019]|uniref:hypothetical protein n=1 Tax=unclassified Erythrobacter TaxID=2633097 RepID=UPI0007B8F0F8|nr:MULTISPECIES: hypothetical protein [unclassified Erythrobacter]KZX93924.1 hypothetical protein A3718_08375 [Erythrobacter sp. HI0019]KZY09119.1 hypothetical protein A3723_10740 [Erythrobacter sp. HI0028]